MLCTMLLVGMVTCQSKILLDRKSLDVNSGFVISPLMIVLVYDGHKSPCYLSPSALVFLTAPLILPIDYYLYLIMHNTFITHYTRVMHFSINLWKSKCWALKDWNFFHVWISFLSHWIFHLFWNIADKPTEINDPHEQFPREITY